MNRFTSSFLAKYIAGLLLFFCCTILSSSAFSYDEDLAKKIIKLRSEIDRLSIKIQNDQQNQKVKLSNMAAVNQDLGLQISRLEREVEGKQHAVEDLKSTQSLVGSTDQEHINGTSLAAEENMRAATAAMFVKEIADIKTSIEQGIPFMAAQRIEALAQIEKDFTNEKVHLAKAVSKLWTFMDDELNLLNDISMAKQSIMLNGENIYSHVIKLGMVQMFYITPQQEYGIAIKKSEGWSFEPIADSEIIAQIDSLSDKIKKNIVQGIHYLPIDMQKRAGRYPAQALR